MRSTTDLAVVVVTWNNADVITDALRSLLEDLGKSDLVFDVWVVDSASDDRTVEIVRQGFPMVNLIASKSNHGFGASNNLAIRQLGFGSDRHESDLPTAVYFLNPDTITHPGASKLLYDALKSRSDVGMVGAGLTFADGSFQHSAFRFPDLPQIWTEFFPAPGRIVEGRLNGRYPRSAYSASEPFEVDFTLGATMMVKRDAIMESGVFDEDFFIYCEEIDWAWRIKELGWRVLCVPGARVTHLGGQSTSQVRPRSLINLWKSRLLLYEKHYPSWKRGLARRLIMSGMRRQLRMLGADNEELRRACNTVIEMANS